MQVVLNGLPQRLLMLFLIAGLTSVPLWAKPSGGTVFSTAQQQEGRGTVSGRVRFDRPSLYAGVGTGTGLIKGLALAIDGGMSGKALLSSVAASIATAFLSASALIAIGRDLRWA